MTQRISRRTAPRSEDVTPNFLGGLILGLIVSAPVAAWLAPQSGSQVRSGIRQRGVLIRHRTTQVIRKPLTAIQSQIEDLRSDSVADLLAEGKSLAHQRAGQPDSSESDNHRSA